MEIRAAAPAVFDNLVGAGGSFVTSKGAGRVVTLGTHVGGLTGTNTALVSMQIKDGKVKSIDAVSPHGSTENIFSLIQLHVNRKIYLVSVPLALSPPEFWILPISALS